MMTLFGEIKLWIWEQVGLHIFHVTTAGFKITGIALETVLRSSRIKKNNLKNWGKSPQNDTDTKYWVTM